MRGRITGAESAGHAGSAVRYRRDLKIADEIEDGHEMATVLKK
jgi:hypothetical protein